MKKWFTFIAFTFLTSNLFAVEYARYEAIVTINSLQMDNDSENELQSIFSLSGGTFGKPDYYQVYLKPTTSVGKMFGGYEKVNDHETVVYKSSFSIPKAELGKTQFSITLIEHDFQIPVIGPCCLYISGNDYFFGERIQITPELNHFEKTYSAIPVKYYDELVRNERRSANIKLTIKKIEEGNISGKELTGDLINDGYASEKQNALDLINRAVKLDQLQ